MPLHKGVWRQEWDICDRCGFEHPISMLSMQLGMKLCKDHGCYDDISNDRRPAIIAAKLADGREGLTDKPEVFRGPGELTF